MEGTLFRGNHEPSLDQILAESAVQILMRRDQVDEGTIRQLMRKAAAARPAARTEPLQASVDISAQAAEPPWPRVFPSL